MPKNKLKKFEGLPEIILKLIKKNKRMSTFAIKRRVSEQGVEVTWMTVKRYLEDLETKKKLKSIVFKDNKIVVWEISKEYNKDD